jgi:diguanylate cyclase (GGDEF)-like protein
MRRARWVAFAGAALLPVYLWVLEGTAADLLWDAFVGAILLLALRTVAVMPRHRAAWLWILAGQVTFFLGDMAYAVASRYVDDIDSEATVVDAVYLAGYPMMAVGLVLLLRVQGRMKDIGGLLDGLLVAAGSGVVFWVYLMAPTLDGSMSVAGRLVACAYPAGDLLLITIVAQVAVRQVRRGRPFELLMASMVALLAADLGYMYLSLHGGYSIGMLVDAGWWISYVLVVTAVLHPDAHRLAAPLTEVERPRLSARRLVMLSAVALVAPLLVVVESLMGHWSGSPALLGGTVVMFTLVVVRLALVARELDESRTQLLQQATHDPLTGLTNRVVFAERVAAAIDQHRSGGDAAVLFIDLDDFKAVNDGLGHAAGDRLLRVIAGRLARIVRPTDVVARFGGDEFAILVEGALPGDRAVDAVASRVIDAICEPIDLGTDMPVYANASVGIAFVDGHDDVDAVLRDADSAMYLAKRRGKGRHVVFEDGMRQQVIDRLRLRVDLDGALERGELVLCYQPVVSVVRGALEGFEALLRWNHPALGEVQPGQFLGIAEESNLLVPIGRWTLLQACADAQRWSSSTGGPEVSVNVSAVQFADPAFVDDVRHSLDRSGLAPHRLVLEVTEAAIASNPQVASRVLEEVARLGVRIALDDLGVGYTSLEQLVQLPVAMVKFDRRFVASCLAGDRSVLRGLIGFAHGLGLATVGEGVETFEQLEGLHDLGCRFAQGFLVGRPMPATDAARVVVEGVDLPCPWSGVVLPVG